jgi:molecular chaperone HscB
MWLRRKLQRLSLPVTDFFALLQMPVACEVDAAILERNYRQLQGEWHPDRFVGAGQAEKLAALQKTSLLNDAYTTLKAPLSRAAHILLLQGCDVDRHEQSDLEPAFLMQQMRLRDALEELASDQDETGLRGLLDTVAGERVALWQALSGAIAAGERQQARKLFYKLQFMVKLQDEIRAVEDRLLGY